MISRVLLFAAFVLLFLVAPGLAGAQAGLPDPDALASQNLRGYTHMFLAYAIAWAIVLGWVVSVGRRLGDVQKSVED